MTNYIKIFCLIITVYFKSTHYLCAQTGDINFDRISIEQGLSQANVYAIMQDKTGFIWLGTTDGLNKFDGYDFTLYKHDPQNQNSLSNSRITSICESSDTDADVIWIGTIDGLNRFEPIYNKFTRFFHDPENSNSLSDNIINAIFEDPLGNIWVGTTGGLSLLIQSDSSSVEFINFTFDPEDSSSLSNNMVYSIYADPDTTESILWIGTADGLNKLILPADYGNTEIKVNKLKHNPAKFFRYLNEPGNLQSISSNDVRAIYVNPDENVVWIGTYGGGLNKLIKDKDQFIHYKYNPRNNNSLSDNSIVSIHQDISGNIWIGTFGGGLNLFDPDLETFTHFKRERFNPRSLSSNVIYKIFEDRTGALWFGTSGGGVCKFDRKKEKFRHYTEEPENPNSLSNHYVKAFYQDDEGIIWIGTGDGLNSYDPQSAGKVPYFKQYRNKPGNPNSLLHSIIFSIYNDPRPNGGKLLIGTLQGLCQLNIDSNSNVYFSNFRKNAKYPYNLKFGKVMAIYVDSYNELWFGTDNGLCRLTYDDNNIEHFTSFEHNPADSTSLSSNYIRKIYEDTHGVLWIATRMGLNKYDRLKEKFVRYINDPGNNNSLINDNVITLHEDKFGERNIIWIATENGLDKFNTEQNSFKHYNEQNGLPNNAILGILEDKNRNLWISTSYGFTKFDPDKNTFTYFDLSDGLQSYEFNYNAYLHARNGEMYFGGVNGFNVFHPDSVRDEDYLPPIVITDFQIFNKPVSIGTDGKPIDRGEKRTGQFIQKSIIATNKIILTYKQNVFSFGYAALDYTAPENNKYAYMMEGFDKNWINAGTRRLATYTNLDPGDYVFKVKGTNNDGVWSDDEATVILIITPPPWKTWWAYTIYVLILIAALVGIRRYELNKRKRKEEEQLRREREAAKLREAELKAKTIQAEKEIEKQQIRTRIATDLHDEIGSNLSSISLISGMLQNQPGLSKEIKEALLDVNYVASKSTESIRDIVWFINPMSDQQSDLISRLKETATSMLANIEFNFVSPEVESVRKINPEVKRNVYLIFKEILNNIIKHSHASQVNICIKEDGNNFSISVKDNGVGFEESTVRKGNGLLNLRNRAKQIKGKLNILTSSGEGTKITLHLNIT